MHVAYHRVAQTSHGERLLPKYLAPNLVLHMRNLPWFGVTKREETYVCIAFMYTKSEEFSRFQTKIVIVTKVSFHLMEFN
jgi:hypothetical protein